MQRFMALPSGGSGCFFSLSIQALFLFRKDSAGTIWIVIRGSEEERAILNSISLGTCKVRWSPSGEHLAFLSGETLRRPGHTWRESRLWLLLADQDIGQRTGAPFLLSYGTRSLTLTGTPMVILTFK
jgi:hypothetical protein